MSELQGLALRKWAQLGKPLIDGDARKLEALLTALESDNADLNAELTETIAAVSDLMDDNAELRRQLTDVATNEWVPIYLRLPTQNGKYLVYRPGSAEGKLRVAYFCTERTHELNKGFGPSKFHSLAFLSVTHWMLIPEPPEEATDE